MATLNLNGTNITLPDGTVFTTSYLTGSNNVTNNNAGKSGNATLTEGGGGAGNTYSGTISDGTAGTTAITQTSGFVEFTGTNTYSGGTNLEGGTIAAGDNSALGTGTLAMTTGTTLQADASRLTLTNAVTLTGSDTVNSNGDALTLSGVISGSGSLTYTDTGVGMLMVSGNNTYSGGTYLDSGILFADSTSALGTGAVTVGDDGATLEGSVSNAIVLNGSLTLDQNSGVFTGVISGMGGLSISGAASLDGTNTYSGGTILDNTTGTIDFNITSDAALGSGSFAINGTGGTQQVELANNVVLSNTVYLDSGTYSFMVDGSATIAGDIYGGALTVTTGTLTLSGTNTYEGGTTLRGGTIAVGDNSALGSGALSMGGTLEAAASRLTLTNAVTLPGSDTVNNNGDALTLSGVISGSGSLTETGSGTLTLSGTNTYTGGTSVAGGTLLIDGSTASSKVTVDSGGTLGGTGTAGAVTVDSGGTFAPGDPSTLTVAGLTLNSGATFDEEIGGTAPGSGGASGYDQTVVESGGTISLGGATLDVSLVNSFAPSVGESFTIINNETGDPVGGTFNGLTEGAAFALDGDYFKISYDGGSNNQDVVLTDIGTSPCYCPGTLIRTKYGNKRVEKLQIGDEAMTASGVARPIKWIGRRSYGGRFVMGRKDVLPVCIEAGALDDNVPKRDLWISPNHAMYFEETDAGGVLIEAKDLINGVSIVQAERVEQIEYFHVELETHDVIIAEGALSETFIDDDSRGMFHNAHDYRSMFPGALTDPAQYCARRLEGGYEIEGVRQRIGLRAGLVPNEETKGVGTLRGYVDLVTPRLIEGWAQNTDYPEAPVCLDIFAGGRLIGQVMANRYRKDLERAGISSGHHSFAFALPDGLGFAPSDTVEVSRSLDQARLPLSAQARRIGISTAA
jgi:O-antigen biosynthesis protein